MLSDKKLLANRQNAQKSTGPRTPEGKRISSQNALTHGLLSREALLPGEEASELDALRAELTADLVPVGALEEMLVDIVVTKFWKLRRGNRFEAALFEYQQKQNRELGIGRTVFDPTRQLTVGEELALVLMAHHNGLEKLARHEASLQRQLILAYHELERSQARRQGGQVAPPAVIDVVVAPETGED
jgi:hypothetical protein